jgi:hypothetical protein
MLHPFLFLSFPSSSISLSSIFIRISPRSFLSLSLSFRYIHSTCAQLSLSLSFHTRTLPVFPLLVPTSKSRHPFSFFCTLSPQVLRNFLCHNLSAFLLYLDSLILSLLSCLFMSLSLSLSSIFVLLLIFRLID